MHKKIFLNPIFILILISFISAFLFIKRDAINPMTVPLIDSKGKTTSLSQYVKPSSTTLIVFWSSWCTRCITQAQVINQLIDENPDVNVVGIQVDDADAKAFDFAKYKSLKSKNNTELLMNHFGDSTDRLPLTVILNQNGETIGSLAGQTDLKQLEHSLKHH